MFSGRLNPLLETGPFFPVIGSLFLTTNCANLFPCQPCQIVASLCHRWRLLLQRILLHLICLHLHRNYFDLPTSDRCGWLSREVFCLRFTTRRQSFSDIILAYRTYLLTNLILFFAYMSCKQTRTVTSNHITIVLDTVLNTPKTQCL